MAILTWEHTSPVAGVEFKPFGKGSEAVLYPSYDATPEQLKNMFDMFISLGMSAFAKQDERGNVNWHIRGFKQEEDVAMALEANGFANPDSRERMETPESNKEEKTNSLVKSGRWYLAGDMALVAAGLRHVQGGRIGAGIGEAAAGLIYALSGVAMARYGKQSLDRAYNTLNDGLTAELARDGVEVPGLEHASAKELGKPNGLIARVEDFLYRHPSETLNVINACAGMALILSGQKQRKAPEAERVGGGGAKQIAGSMVVAGMVSGLLIPEKKKTPSADSKWIDPDAKEKKGIGRLLQERPNLPGGALALCNNVVLTISAIQAKKSYSTRPALQHSRHRNDPYFNIAAVAAYAPANFQLAKSPKSGDVTQDNVGSDLPGDLYARAANIALAQPPEDRERVIRKAAYYLAEQKHIPHGLDEITHRIEAEVDALQPTWVGKIARQSQPLERADALTR